jgi:hypothetical protein
MIDFAELQATLDAIADKANSDVDGPGCPHKRFWNVTRQQFISGEVPNITIRGVTYHIPIVTTTPGQELNSAFYRVLVGSIQVTEGAQTATIPQMPASSGPFITEEGYTVTVKGVTKTGDQIKAEIEEWLTHGMP